VINNTINNEKAARRRSVTIDPATMVSYPLANDETVAPSVQPEPESLEILDSGEINELRLRCDLYKEIALCLSRILKTDNQKLIANLIDRSGKVIIDVTSLCIIISKQLNVPVDCVHIEYVQKDGGCFGCFAASGRSPLHRMSKIHDVSNIKINHVDYKWAYNEKYNILGDEFSLSLSRVIA
jgi:hypothetical protein